MIQFLLSRRGFFQPKSRKIKSFLAFFSSVINIHLNLHQASRSSRQPQCLLLAQNLLVSPLLHTPPGLIFCTPRLSLQISAGVREGKHTSPRNLPTRYFSQQTAWGNIKLRSSVSALRKINTLQSRSSNIQGQISDSREANSEQDHGECKRKEKKQTTTRKALEAEVKMLTVA